MKRITGINSHLKLESSLSSKDAILFLMVLYKLATLDNVVKTYISILYCFFYNENDTCNKWKTVQISFEPF